MCEIFGGGQHELAWLEITGVEVDGAREGGIQMPSQIFFHLVCFVFDVDQLPGVEKLFDADKLPQNARAGLVFVVFGHIKRIDRAEQVGLSECLQNIGPGYIEASRVCGKDAYNQLYRPGCLYFPHKNLFQLKYEVSNRLIKYSSVPVGKQEKTRGWSGTVLTANR
jgi:hypothetical protein